MILTSAAVCLAANIYFEAAGEPLAGQIAVANVTINRVLDNKTSVCTEVLKPSQFSWTTNMVTAKNSKPAVLSQFRPKSKQDLKAWLSASRLATAMIRDPSKFKDATKGSTHYHNLTVKPSWTRNLKISARIGNHVFYVSKDQATQFKSFTLSAL